MAKCDLMSLERRVVAHRRGRRSPVVSQSLPDWQTLQEEIDVVRGRKVVPPSRNLRQLEQRLTGKRPAGPQTRRQDLRIDQGQLGVPVVPADVVVEPLSPASVESPASLAAEDAAPEFSAPLTGRFYVEPFDTGLAAIEAEAAEPSQPEAVRRTQEEAVDTPALSPQGEQEKEKETTAAAPVEAVPQGEDSAGKAALSPQPEEAPSPSAPEMAAEVKGAKEAFEKDLESILKGKPESAPGSEPEAEAFPGAGPTTTAEAGQQGEAQEAAALPSHEIFDRMGLGMSYANRFDLGKIDLAKRFDDLEKGLGLGEEARPSSDRPAAEILSAPDVPDDFDLVAELAQIDEASAAPQETPQSIQRDENIGDHDEHATD